MIIKVMIDCVDFNSKINIIY